MLEVNKYKVRRVQKCATETGRLASVTSSSSLSFILKMKNRRQRLRKGSVLQRMNLCFRKGCINGMNLDESLVTLNFSFITCKAGGNNIYPRRVVMSKQHKARAMLVKCSGWVLKGAVKQNERAQC